MGAPFPRLDRTWNHLVRVKHCELHAMRRSGSGMPPLTLFPVRLKPRSDLAYAQRWVE